MYPGRRSSYSYMYMYMYMYYMYMISTPTACILPIERRRMPPGIWASNRIIGTANGFARSQPLRSLSH